MPLRELRRNSSKLASSPPRFLLRVLAGVLLSLAAGLAHAQTYQVLHSFFVPFQSPATSLIQGPDGLFYGTLEIAGGNNGGAVFKVDTLGNLTTLHTFAGDDGSTPSASLTHASDGFYYGVTGFGGASGMGTVYKIDSSGAFTLLHSFSGSDGASPAGRLFEATDGKLYGTTQQGGGGGVGLGTVFRIDGTGTFSSLHGFTVAEGGYPVGGVTQASDGKLYGTGQTGGTNGIGIVFQMTTTGTLVVIHNFAATEGVSPSSALLLLSDGKLYGTAESGGANSKGSVFRVDTAGTLNVLKSFAGSDGDLPSGDLFQGSDAKLYGMTRAGGTGGFGTAYRIDAAGTNFASLHSFASTDGQAPHGGVIQATDSNFYATTHDGGSAGGGTVFRMSSAGAVATVYAFGAPGQGHEPSAALVSGTDGKLYGTTNRGGAAGTGTAFKIDTAGVFTLLHAFTAPPDPGSNQAALMQGGDGNFYGASAAGGTGDLGSVFRLTTGGTVTLLHSFADADGDQPLGGLVQGTDGRLYGTTYSGGANELGTVYRIDTAGTGFTTLHPFAGSEGASPRGKLIQATDGNFYGTTESGGAAPQGNVYRMTAAGAVTSLHAFGGTDGMWPFGGVIQAPDGKLYGTTRRGGDLDNGSVYRMDTPGTFARLKSFGPGEGANPYGELVVGSDGALYGTTYGGGASGKGTVFRITTAGAFSTIHDFSGPDGNGAPAGLVKGSDNALYGVTNQGGAGAAGVVFRITTCVTPVATITAPASVCPSAAGNSASVPDAGPGATYAWTIGNGTVTAGAGTRSITFTAGTSGSVSLSITVTASGGCSASGSKTISISTLCSTALSFFTVAPCRVIDTRNPNGPLGGPALAANADRSFVIRGTCGIPVTAKVTAVNVTVTGGTALGNLIVYPGGSSVPLTSTINYRAFQTRANNAIVPLGASGDMLVHCSQASGTVHLILDVTGYFQ